jgi:hypothetical protein
MPEGPPPGVQKDDEDDSDDDIPMPEGPPPNGVSVAIVNGPDHILNIKTTAQLGSSSFPNQTHILTPSIQMPPSGIVHLPPVYDSSAPPLPPPPGFPASPSIVPPPPPPPPGFPTGPSPVLHAFPNFPPQHLPPPPPGFPSRSMPPPPPGFFPRQQSVSAMQDPLSSIPHQTFQAHRDGRSTIPSFTLPVSASHASSNVNVAAATLSAEPQLRDLKKEATAFVPTSVKRKKAGGNTQSTSKINAAPTLGPGIDPGDPEAVVGPSRPDLLTTLKNQFGPAPMVESGTSKQKDDYEKFVEEMGDILHS